MGYKRIRPVVRNFGHSSVSLMNYVDGAYIIDILGKVVPQPPEGESCIRFPGGRMEPPRDYLHFP